MANCVIAPGEEFCFTVNFFDSRQPALGEFGRALGELAGAELAASSAEPNALSLEPRAEVRRLRIEFATPTEMKTAQSRSGLAPMPEFDIVFARARDRVSTLRALYGPGPLEIDFRAARARAGGVRMAYCDLRPAKQARRSSRSGQVHTIGGFVGTAEYEGALTEFVPILEAAQWTGIGRHCVWGNGEIRLRVL